MLNWVAKVFRSWIEVVLWLILIISTIIGGVIGNAVGSFSRGGGYTFWGVVFGALAGLIVVVIGGGIITNFLSMVDNIAEIKAAVVESEKLEITEVGVTGSLEKNRIN